MPSAASAITSQGSHARSRGLFDVIMRTPSVVIEKPNVHTIQAPTPFATAKEFAFDGVTPYADAYAPKNTDAPDGLQYALLNAPPGTTVNGAVYWQVYRALVTNVVLINPSTGQHLAQWNIWQPGAPLP